jgi:hypothetical protein
VAAVGFPKKPLAQRAQMAGQESQDIKGGRGIGSLGFQVE